MIPLLLIGAAAFAAGVIVSKFWKQIANFLRRSFELLPEHVQQLVKGAVSLISKIGSTFKNIIKHYSYNSEKKQWTEHRSEKVVPESDVPEHIRNQAKHQSEVDVSNELTEQLKMSH